MPRERKIIIENVWPPIPVRSFDWRAIFDGYEPGDIMGYGKTSEEAVADLLEQAGNEERYERA